MRNHILPLFIALAMLPSGPVNADQLALPAGRVLLTVTGNIVNTNGDGVAHFDLAMLDALAQRTTFAETPWYKEAKSFSGPLASALLSAVGANGTIATVTALNDYSAEIPLTDFTEFPVILASRINGVELSVREKGPLFLVYPFDIEPDLYNEVYFGRSVWQIKSIAVR